MVGKALKWSPRAKKELAEIVAFFRLRNGNDAYSKKLRAKFHDAARRIEANETIGQVVEDGNNVRFVVVAEHYQLLYRLELHHNTVVTVWDGRRNPDDLKVE